MGYVCTWMGDHLSSGPGMGICFCRQTFINSSALLVSMMAVQLTHVEQNSFQPCYLVKRCGG